MNKFEKGKQLQEKGKLEEALAAYQQALNLNSKDSEVYHHIGEVLAKLGRYDEAIAAYRNAIEVKPDFSWSYHQLGDALTRQQQWEASAATFRKAIELNPEHFGTYVGLGNSLEKLGKLDEAIAAYRRANDLNPDTDWIYDGLANLLRQRTQSDLAEAISSYRHIIELNPDNLPAYDNLLQLQPDNSETWLHFARAFVRQEKIEEAIAAYDRSIAVNSSSMKANYELAVALARLEKWQEAMATCQRAVELAPELAEAYCLLGETQANLELKAEATASYRHAGELLVKQGKIDEATSAYQQLIQLSPGAPDYFNLGMLLLQQHQVEEALNCYQKALEIQPEQAENFSNLAILSIRQGLLKEVISCYHQAFKGNPSHAGAYHRLSIILAEKGLIDEAIACFRETPHKQPSQGEIYEQIWKGLNQLSLLDESNPDYQVEINPEDAKNYFMQANPYRTIILESLTDDDKSFLDSIGISLTNLQLITQDKRVLEEIYINSFARESLSDRTCDGSNFSYSPPIKLAQKVDRRFAYYQQSLVETGYVYTVCPLSGKILRSDRSVYIQHNSFLPTGISHFAGKEIFYLIFGCHHAVWLGIYFPRWELIIRPTNSPFSTDYFTLLNELKGGAIGFWQKFKQYISNEDKKEIAAVAGWLGNLGHYIWNDLSGLQSLSDNEILSKVNVFLMGNYNFFNIDEIFPEIRPENIVQLHDKWSLFRTTLENNYCTVRLTDLVIKERLANNIYQAAVNRCSQEFLQKLAKAKKLFPLVWIQIRITYRVWVSQVESIANIIKALHSDYPNLGVVIAGNWYFTETDEIEGCPQVENEKATLEEILSLLPPDINVYTVIGSPSYELIAWANAIDTYFVPFASGITFVSLIANKPGVMHATVGLAPTAEPTVLSMRENAVSPVVPKEHFADINRGTHPVFPDYDCDWKIIYDEVVKIINNLDRNE